MPWIMMMNRACKIGQLPSTHWFQGRAKCLGQYFLMRGHPSTWWEEYPSYLLPGTNWWLNVWGFFKECNKFCNNNNNNNVIMMMMIIIINLKNVWPILFDRRGSTTFGQRFWLHLWNRVPCQGSRRAHCQTAHGTERADSEEKDDPSDKVRREGKRKKKSVCHFSMLDLGVGGGRSGSMELGLWWLLSQQCSLTAGERDPHWGCWKRGLIYCSEVSVAVLSFPVVKGARTSSQMLWFRWEQRILLHGKIYGTETGFVSCLRVSRRSELLLKYWLLSDNYH